MGEAAWVGAALAGVLPSSAAVTPRRMSLTRWRAGRWLPRVYRVLLLLPLLLLVPPRGWNLLPCLVGPVLKVHGAWCAVAGVAVGAGAVTGAGALPLVMERLLVRVVRMLG